MEFLYLIFYTCLRLRFMDVVTNPGSGVLFPLSADFYVVMCGPGQNLIVTWPWRRLGMTYCCARRFLSLICVTCRSCWFSDLVAVSRDAGQDASGLRDGGIRTRWIWNISPTQIWVRVLRNAGFKDLWCEKELTCAQSLPQPWPRRQDFWLFTNIVGCCAGWEMVGYPWDCHHQEWLGYTTTNHHSVAAFVRNCLIAISWLSARPIHEVEHFTFWWLTFLT